MDKTYRKPADSMEEIESMYSFERKRVAKFRLRLFLFIALAFCLGLLWGTTAHADTVLVDMNRHIRFETIQAVSITIAFSLFLWMLATALRAWFKLVLGSGWNAPR